MSIWDVANGRQIGPASIGHKGPISGIVFSPDGEVLYSSGTFDRSIIRWDAGKGEPIGDPLVWTSPLLSLALSPDGALLATGSFTELTIWDAVEWRLAKHLRVSKVDGEGAILGVGFSPDGRLASTDGEVIELWDPRGSSTTREWSVSGPSIGTGGILAFNRDGTLLGYGRSDGTIAVIAVASGELTGAPLIGRATGITGIAFSPMGDQVATITPRRGVSLWTLEPRLRIAHPIVGVDPAISVGFNPDGRSIAVGSYSDYSIDTWGLDGDTHIAQMVPPVLHDWATDLVYNADGTSLAASGFGDLGRWDPATGRPIAAPVGPCGDYGTFENLGVLAVSADQKTAVCGKRAPSGSGAELVVIDLARNVPTVTLQTEYLVQTLAVTSDGKLLAAGGQDGTTAIWDLTSGESLAQLPSPTGASIVRVTFSTDGTLLAVGDDIGAVIIRDAHTLAQVGRPMAEQNAYFDSIAISPDDSLLASADASTRTLTLWRIADGRPIGKIDGVTSAAFSPDGNSLVTAGQDQTVLWDLRPDAWRATACRTAGRNLTADEWALYMPGEEYRPTCP